MTLKKRPGSDCLRQPPFENPANITQVMQNFHWLVQWIAEVECRFQDQLSCEGLRELWEECDLCELVCQCVCPPDTRLLVQLESVPLENIEANGYVWVGDVDQNSDTYYKVFDPATGEKVANIVSLDDTILDSRSGCSACYHSSRREVWIAGGAYAAGNPTPLVVRVHDDAPPFAVKATYTFPTYQGGIQFAPPIETCPATGDIYVGYENTIPEVPPNGWGGVLRLDPATGAILGDGKAADAATYGASGSRPYYMSWHEGLGKFVVGSLRDRQFHLDPVTMAGGAFGPEVGGIVKTGDVVPQSTYDRDLGNVFLVPEKEDDSWFWTSDSALNQSWIAWTNTDDDPEANFCFYHGGLRAAVVSRGKDSFIFSDPLKNGRVSLYRAVDESLEREVMVPYNPARSCYCPAVNKLAVVSHWAQAGPWFVEFIPLDAGSDLTIRNPRLENEEPGEVGEIIDGPYLPPDAPPADDPPDETDPPADQLPLAPCTPVPTLVSGALWCEAIDNPPTVIVRTGWRIAVQASFCRGISNPASLNTYEIVGWDEGKNPLVDPPNEVLLCTPGSGTDGTLDGIDGLGPGQEWRKRMPTAPYPVSGFMAERSGTIGDPNAPRCGGLTGAPLRVTRTYYVRRNVAGETGPGALSANSVTLTFTDPAT